MCALVEPNILYVGVGRVLLTIAVGSHVTLEHSSEPNPQEYENLKQRYLVNDDRIINVTLGEELKGDILDNARADVLSRPCLDTSTILCVRHFDVAIDGALSFIIWYKITI